MYRSGNFAYPQQFVPMPGIVGQVLDCASLAQRGIQQFRSVCCQNATHQPSFTSPASTVVPPEQFRRTWGPRITIEPDPPMFEPSLEEISGLVRSPRVNIPCSPRRAKRLHAIEIVRKIFTSIFDKIIKEVDDAPVPVRRAPSPQVSEGTRFVAETRDMGVQATVVETKPLPSVSTEGRRPLPRPLDVLSTPASFDDVAQWPTDSSSSTLRELDKCKTCGHIKS
jgi:hypothetical protein